MKAIILAAGRGNRLRPLTDEIPKSLVKINGETLLERHLKNLSKSLFDEAIINLSYRGDQIEDYIGNGSRFGINVKYSREGSEPLETLGGILKAVQIMGSVDKFAVLNGDIWTNYPFENLRAVEQDAHIILAPKPNDRIAGDFDLSDNTVIESDTNPFVFTGIAKYNSRVFKGIPTGRKKLGPLLKKWSKSKCLTGELFKGKWFDIGTLDRLKAANLEILRSS
ncbi:MAG: nucleotidyltransferase family protein [Pseudomonadota bacterium]|nr:nucleotidyltransferase family protein [Pseudomonadota bacterium]